MNASDIFRQGFIPGTLRPPAPPQQYYPQLPRQPPPPSRESDTDRDAPSRVAHTLTACCRCRQRKTRCDPTLPRCLPCERSGSVCEYYDSTKGRKMSRFYVLKLQEKVRQLEAELAHFTEEELPENNEDMIRPGGFVSLGGSDEPPRYLGPSSGIAMTRLLMEEAKRYTESQRISDLIPKLNARRIERMSRMQSIAGLQSGVGSSFSSGSLRKKSYPMISGYSAQSLPSRPIAERLVEVFNSRAQVFTPTLHEVLLDKHINEVYGGDTDPYKNFVVRMVMAIGLQKLDTQYAGLADSYYLAAMENFEDAIRPKDIRTLQCLVLIGQYSLLTPTRTNVYHIVGLATRICQQLAITDEKTIASGSQVNALQLDLRRRLSWIVATMELGLAHSMGRPNGLSKGNDFIDVGFFADIDDQYIKETGIEPGPISDKKRVAIHFCKMRMCQAEIRRVLYEKKRSEPQHENHPWFAQMETKMQQWLDSAPLQPAWCKSWFTGRYHTMIVALYRPSPQLSKPSPAAALRCYESSAHNTNLGGRQVRNNTIDITWVFLLTIFMSLNTILWSVSYPEVREQHPREETEELINTSLDVIDQCSERWPGASAASQLYSIFARACLQSYDTFENQQHHPQQAPPVFSATKYGGPETGFHSPSSDVDPSSPSPASAPPVQTLSSGEITQQQQAQQTPVFNTPQFGYLFDNSGELVNQTPFTYDEGPNAGQPQFRSGSIFLNPASTEPMGRRFSYFPPEGPPPMNSSDSSLQDEETPRTSTDSSQTTGVIDLSPSIITSPEAFISPPSGNSFISMSPATTIETASSPTPTPTMSQINALPVGTGFSQGMPLIKPVKFESPTGTPQIQQVQPFQWPPTQSVPPNKSMQQQKKRQQQQQQQQQPLPPPLERNPQTAVTAADWFSQQEPFISPYTFRSITGTGIGGYTPDPATAFTGYGLGGFGGLSNPLSPLTGSFGAVPAGIGGGPGSLGVPSLGLLSGGQANFNTAGSGGRPGVMDGFTMADAFGFGTGGPLNPQRQGSLSQEQQMELMDVLETEGMSDIDQFFTMGTGLTGIKSEEAGGLNW
ncbi:hypothetical protein SEPCBS57363_000301 [Sporothrix epigloea]|uniref:Zn(2)-C6 fungal-type domain-containing protein n=1 Tax=Sporothrix epigloea TaxID=1892477 RepID=A0ABP0D5H3_9PEZI